MLGGAVILAATLAATALSGPLPETPLPETALAEAQSLGDPTSFPGSGANRFDTLADRAYMMQSLERTAVVGPTEAIAVANLTVEPGRYLVSYQFESRLVSDRLDAELNCGLVDNNGVDRFLVADPEPVTVGTDWTRHTVVAPFSLPDVTLGIRCLSDRTDLVHALFRKVSLSVVTLAADERP